MSSDHAQPDRHHRQRILPEIGDAGQESLRHAHAAIIGCGALGTHLADTLCRAGVSWLTIIDRDIVEHTNLQRQILFTEDHANRGAPKAEAAKEAIQAIDPQCNVRAIVDDLNANNIDDLLPLPTGEGRGEGSSPSPSGRRWQREALTDEGRVSFPPITLLLDGADNFETRFLLNDLAIARHIPLVYAGVIGTTGLMTAVLPASPSRPAGGDKGRATSPTHSSIPPRAVDERDEKKRVDTEPPPQSSPARRGRRQDPSPPGRGWPSKARTGEGSEISPLPFSPTPCLRCLFDDAPPPGSAPTCDTAGVLGPAVSIIAGFQATEALKILTGDFASVTRALFEIDAWRTTTRRIDTTNARNPDCPCCAHHHFDYLDNISASTAVSLCGRNAVQITPGAQAAINLPALAARLAPHGDFHTTDHLLRGVLHTEPIELTVFPTGRAIIKGVDDAGKARAIYARFVGA